MPDTPFPADDQPLDPWLADRLASGSDADVPDAIHEGCASAITLVCGGEAAYSSLVSAGGGSERNWSVLLIPNGRILPHCTRMPPWGQPGVGCHSPGLAEVGREN